jgi:hypothetical protein
MNLLTLLFDLACYLHLRRWDVNNAIMCLLEKKNVLRFMYLLFNS